MDWPPPEDPPAEELVRVADLASLAEGRPRAVRVGVKQIMLVRLGERVYATSNVCPHAGSSLALGRLSGRLIVCARHDLAFDLQTGACPDHDVYCLPTYRVEIRGGQVWVALPESRW